MVCLAILYGCVLGCLALCIGMPCYGLMMVVALEMVILIMLSVAIVAVSG